MVTFLGYFEDLSESFLQDSPQLNSDCSNGTSEQGMFFVLNLTSLVILTNYKLMETPQPCLYSI